MRTIHKYPLTFKSAITEVTTFAGSKIVLVDHQNNVPAIWMLVDTHNPRQKREFAVYGTGHSIPWDFNWVGSYQCGLFVWHVFEKGES